MRLPEEDEEYLAGKGLNWTTPPDTTGGLLLTISDFPVNATKYSVDKTDVMIRIPPQYNIARLDMFYADPPVMLRNGTFPPAADNFEVHGGRRWQRFSRHMDTIVWRPGIDRVQNFLALVTKELQGKD